MTTPIQLCQTLFGRYITIPDFFFTQIWKIFVSLDYQMLSVVICSGGNYFLTVTTLYLGESISLHYQCINFTMTKVFAKVCKYVTISMHQRTKN